MRIEIFFDRINEIAILSLGLPSENDKNYVFRLALNKQGEDGVYPHEAGWVEINEINKLKSSFKKGDSCIVKIERRNKTTNKIEFLQRDIDNNWPSEDTKGPYVFKEEWI